MTYLKDPYTFDKNSWLKRQNPFAQCCAHDVINSAGSSLCDTLRYATVMAKIRLDDKHTLVIFSDFSAVLALDLQSQNGFMMMPDPVRVKKHNNGIHLILENIRMHGNQKRLRIQVKDQVSTEFDHINFQHPFLQTIGADARKLLEGLKNKPAAPLHTNWDDWTPDQVRPWQNPTMGPKRDGEFQTVTRFFMDQLGIDKSMSLQMPLWKNASVSPFKPATTAHKNPQRDALVACLNDPDLGAPTRYVNNAKQLNIIVPQDFGPLTGHTKLKLLAIAQKHAHLMKGA